MKILRLHISVLLLAVASLVPVAFSQLPNIKTVAPGMGVTGTSVTITGTNFGSTGTVTFNGVTAPNPVWGATTITVAAPGLATTGNVVVTTSAGSSNGVQFIVVPNITAISPTLGPAGAALEVEGTGFGTTTGSLTINTVAATPTFWSDTQVNCEVPGTVTGSGPVVITAGGNLSNQNVIFTIAVNGSISGTISNTNSGAGISGATVTLYLSGVLQSSTTTATGGTYSFTNLAPGEYSLTITAAGFVTANVAAVPVGAGGITTENVALTVPNITALTPSSGPVGTVVIISGSYFGVSQGTVTFDAIAATPSLWTNTAITVPVPTGAKTGNVVVTTGGANSNAVKFTVGAGTIAGTITQSSNGAVVSGAAVKAYQLGVLKKSATSSATGTYTLSGLAPGSFDIEVTDSSLATTILSAITATAGVTTTENVVLSSTPGGISGTVTQSNGTTAVSGAKVNVLQGYTVAATATTSTSGTYTLASLAAGTYVVSVTATGFDTQTTSGIVVATGSTATANFSLPTQDAITYAYDQASRLSGVVDALGNTAVYNYDAAGNIKTITQNASSAISIIDFAPGNGPIGTTVTVNGTGFSATKSSDQVKFNGTTATVTSATTTQIVVTVPSGATTGTITVKSPAGTATSGASFTVTATNGLPTVTSFSPSIATAGTAVSIVGTNFAPVAANDSITVNLNKTYATSATATTISTTIPGITTTGHVTVTTTLGSSVPSAGYLFVPPAGYTVAQVGYTGGTTLGSPATVTIGTADLIGLLAVDVPQSDGLYITTTNNFPSSVPYTIYDPYGNVVGSGNVPTGTSYIETTKHITAAGTCTILIAPGANTGNVVLTPGAISPDITAPITVGGSPVTIATTTPGQNGHLTFTGIPGERVYLYVYNPTGTKDQFGNQGASLNMLDPTGNQILGWGAGAPGGTWYGYSGLITLNASGTYTINFTPSGLSTWGATFQVGSVPADVSGTITVSPAGGPPAPVTIATQSIGQSAHLSFTGTANQRLYLYVYNPTGAKDQYGNQGAGLNMLNPTGGQILGWGAGAPGSTWYGYSNLITLSTAGTYTINFTPSQLSTWGGTFQLVTIPTDISGTITVSPAAGPPAPVTIATQYPGQSAHLSFTGTANQRLYLYVYNPTGAKDQYGNQGAGLNMLNPTGGQILGWGAGAPGSTWYGYSGLITLTAAGTYTINFTPSQLSLWGATFQLVTIPADVSGTITVSPASGPPAPVTIATQYPGQSAHLSFTGTANQRLYLYVYNPTGAKDQYGNQGAGLNMLNPTGGQILGWGAGAPGSTWYGYSNLITLSTAGTYTINFTPSQLSTWGGTFQLVTIPTDISGTITVSPAAGPPAPVTIATQYPGQSAHLSFTGTANQRLYLYVYNPTGAKDQYGNQGAGLNMLNPTGGQILGWGAGAPGSTWYGYSGLITLTAAGTYTINFTPSQLSLWGATFQLVTIPADVSNSIVLGTPVAIATSYVGQSGHLTFDNTVQNQQVYLYAYNPTGTKDQYGTQGSGINMLDPSGNQLLGWGGGAPGSTWTGCSSVLTLASVGNYTINFTPSGLSLWGATFELTTTPCP